MYLLSLTLISFFLFVVLSVVMFYIPGFIIIARNRKQLEDQEIIPISLSLGIVLFILIAFALAFLNLRYLFLPIVLVISFFAVIKYKLELIEPWSIFVKNKILLMLIIAGIIVQGIISFPSGYLYKDGINFWSSQGHDGIWHVALMEEIKKGLPPQNPIFAGEYTYNYHYLVDILMGEFSRIFPFFSTLDLYFRFFPVIFSLLMGISVYALMTRWQQNKAIGYLAVFFTYFVGSFGYIVTFIKSGIIFGGETVFWAAQQNTILGNPPHAVSHNLLATFFLVFLIYLKENKLIWLVVSFILVSALAGFKVSGGFVMLTGVVAAALVDLLIKRRLQIVGLAFLLALSNFITFKLMTSKDATSFLMFLPWWFVRTVIVDKLGWMDLELKRQHYVAQNTWHAWLRVLQLEITAFTIFVVGNLGMRILGLYSIINNIFKGDSYKKAFEVMLMVTMLTGLVVPTFFVQKGIIYNNIQFMQYFLFIFGFYAAITVYNLINFFKNKWIRFCIIVLIVMFSVPTVIGNINEFYGPGRKALAKISNQDLEALNYLKYHSDPEAVVLTKPFNKNLKDKFPEQPKPIYAWYSTAYIPALTGRKVYLTSEEQALITGYPIDARLSTMKNFFEQNDFSYNRKFLQKASIDYVYIAKNEIDKPLDMENNGLDIFFENNEVIIYKVL